MMGDEAPVPCRRPRPAAARLRALREPRRRTPDITDKHWIYYPEDTVFHRIFVQGNASPYCNPPGGFGLTCEITYAPSKPLPCDGEALVDLCIADCIRWACCGRTTSSSLATRWTCRTPTSSTTMRGAATSS
jgi:UDP-galactopyranose mutase